MMSSVRVGRVSGLIGKAPGQRRRSIEHKRRHQYLCPSWIKSSVFTPPSRLRFWISRMSSTASAGDLVEGPAAKRKGLSLRERFQGSFDNFFGRAIGAARELLLKQFLAVTRQTNGGAHRNSIRAAPRSHNTKDGSPREVILRRARASRHPKSPKRASRRESVPIRSRPVYQDALPKPAEM